MPSPPRSFPGAVPASRVPVTPELTDGGQLVPGRPVPRLWRSRSNRVFAGVIGGLAEKLGWEARPMRLLVGLATLSTAGVTLIPYAVLWAITHAHGPAPLYPRYWRSRSNEIFAGVLGGLAEKWGRNATMLRALYTVGTIMTGVIPGVLAYLFVWTGTKALDDPHRQFR